MENDSGLLEKYRELLAENSRTLKLESQEF
jgi:hypothetical protein